MWQFLIDENLSPAYQTQLLRHEPSLKVLAVGAEGSPPKSTSDPEILVWCEQNDFILITNNRKSMPQHLSDHLDEGNHVPGIFTINLEESMGKIIQELLLIVGASEKEEYTDKIKYIPLR